MDRQADLDWTIEETLVAWPEAAHIFLRRRMACVGCSMARFDTLGDAARIYGIPAGELLAEFARGGRA